MSHMLHTYHMKKLYYKVPSETDGMSLNEQIFMLSAENGTKDIMRGVNEFEDEGAPDDDEDDE